MHRFIAMHWEATAEAPSHRVEAWQSALKMTSIGWVTVVDAPGLRVFSYAQSGDAPAVTRLEGATGVILGDLFERGRECEGALASLSRERTREIVATAGDALIAQYWGQYVALWRDDRTGNLTLLRDPCGAVSCFMMRAIDVDLCFSNAADIAPLTGVCVSIDWDYLRAFLLHGYFTTKHTGLREVTELLAGQRLVQKRAGAHELSWAWTANAFAADPSFGSLNEIQGELRETTFGCIAALARGRRRVLVQLSGGLDSSILLAILRRVSDCEVIGLHAVSNSYEGYEFALARKVAEHTATELAKYHLEAEGSDLGAILSIPRLARASRQIVGYPANLRIADVCARYEANTTMAGHGGDSLFLQRSVTQRTVADYLQLRGLRLDLSRIAYDAAALEGRSVFAVLKQTLGDTLFKKSWRPYAFLDDDRSGQTSLFNGLALKDIPKAYISHPWLEGAADLPGGKADHLAGILGLYNFYVTLGYGVTSAALNPYVSQPIMELVLRTPTYQFGRGGLDRALQRNAFRDLIPEAVAQRTGKGFLNHHLLRTTQRNATFLRELVVEGDLVKHGLIDQETAGALFTPAQLAHGGGLTAIHALVAAEAWLRAWRT